jgi:cysteine desulfurase
MSAQSRTLYLDYHATTPVDSRVLEEMLPYFMQAWGNAASKDHRYGAAAKTIVEESREEIAGLIGARTAEIVFTSGATESNNLALVGVVRANAPERGHIITSAIEHPAVLDPLIELGAEGLEVTVLPVDSVGRVAPEDVANAIRPDTLLVSVMAANNEVGTLEPLDEIGAITRSAGVLLHTDATQALGYVDIDVRELGVDLLSGSAHKLYGPKGAGFLFVSGRDPRVKLSPLLRGGDHEAGRRSGTLNVPGIVGLAAAMRWAATLRDSECHRLRELTEYMFSRFESGVGDVRRNGDREHRLPNNLNVGFRGVRAKSLVVSLPDLAFSTGSACSTAKAEPSHVLKALGLSDEEVRESVRFGLGRSTTRDDVDYAVNRIAQVVARIRSAKRGVA